MPCASGTGCHGVRLRALIGERRGTAAMPSGTTMVRMVDHDPARSLLDFRLAEAWTMTSGGTLKWPTPSIDAPPAITASLSRYFAGNLSGCRRATPER